MATDPWVKKETTSVAYAAPKSYRAPKARDFFAEQNTAYKTQAPIRMAEEAESEKKVRLLAEDPGQEGAAGMFAALPTRKQERLAGLGIGIADKGRRSGSGGGTGTGTGLVQSGGGPDGKTIADLVDSNTKALDSVYARTQELVDSGYAPPGMLKKGDKFIDDTGAEVDEATYRDRVFEQVRNQYIGQVEQVVGSANTAQTANDYLKAAAEARRLGLDMSTITETRMAPGTTDIYGRTAAEVPGVKGGLFRKFVSEGAGQMWSAQSSTTSDTSAPTAPPAPPAPTASTAPTSSIESELRASGSASDRTPAEHVAAGVAGVTKKGLEMLNDRTKATLNPIVNAVNYGANQFVVSPLEEGLNLLARGSVKEQQKYFDTVKKKLPEILSSESAFKGDTPESKLLNDVRAYGNMLDQQGVPKEKRDAQLKKLIDSYSNKKEDKSKIKLGRFKNLYGNYPTLY